MKLISLFSRSFVINNPYYEQADNINVSESKKADRVILAAEEIKEKQNQPGRNQPCGCGSGLKYKKCCLT